MHSPVHRQIPCCLGSVVGHCQYATPGDGCTSLITCTTWSTQGRHSSPAAHNPTLPGTLYGPCNHADRPKQHLSLQNSLQTTGWACRSPQVNQRKKGSAQSEALWGPAKAILREGRWPMHVVPHAGALQRHARHPTIRLVDLYAGHACRPACRSAKYCASLSANPSALCNTAAACRGHNHSTCCHINHRLLSACRG